VTLTQQQMRDALLDPFALLRATLTGDVEGEESLLYANADDCAPLLFGLISICTGLLQSLADQAGCDPIEVVDGMLAANRDGFEEFMQQFTDQEGAE
jgi:hypothetical protein